jgi:formamidopyrimidine-DNA glycosylase
MAGLRFERVVARRPDLRIALPGDFAKRLEGRTVRAVDRRGKYLLVELSSGDVLIMHLGMSGSFRIERPAVRRLGAAPDLDRCEFQPAQHDHVIFHMSSGATIVYNDPRRFGFMDLLSGTAWPRADVTGRLGPEPLGRDFDAAALARACRARKSSLKVALLDQRVVAGLGNIYACEALHRAHLSPKRRASTIATRTGGPLGAANRLADAIKKTLAAAIDATRSRNRRGQVRYGSARFRVYDREGQRCPTPRCMGRIRRIVQAGRSTFFCPVCQR